MSSSNQVQNSNKIIALSEIKLHFVLGSPNLISFVSKQINQLFGFSAEDFLTGSVIFEDLIHPDDRELSLSLFSNQVHHGLAKINFRIRKKNTRIQCITGTYKKYRKKDSSEIILELLLQNSNSLNQTIEKHTLLANFSAMMQVTDDYIYFKDRNHVFTGASQTLVSVSDPSEHWTNLIGLTDYDIFPEEYADRYYSQEKMIFNGEVSIAQEIQPLLGNNGKHGWIDNRKYPIKDKNGEIIGLFGIARDISDVRQLQKDLIKKVEQLETSNKIFDEAGDAIAIIKDDSFIDCNKAILKLLGFKNKNDFLEYSLLELSPRQQPDNTVSSVKLEKHIALALKNGIHRFDWVNQTTKGNLIDAEITLTAIIINNEKLLHVHWRDTSERKEMLQTIKWQATHDPLTNLPNRTLLIDRFERAIGNAKRLNKQMLVCMLDLDRFKPINDTFGHDIGDKLIVNVSNRLNTLIRCADTVSRLGGDEFVLLLCDFDTTYEMKKVLQRALDTLSEPYIIDSHTINITASIGVALYPSDDVDADTLLRHADQAMYMAKQAGRNRVHWFDVGRDKEEQSSLDIINSVEKAIKNQEFCLYYQPKVNMRTKEIIGMEALLRWEHPEKGQIPPLNFLPLIEQTDLIITIGDWVMHQALTQIKQWSDQGYAWRVSVNIAARHFQLVDFYQRLEDILATHQQVAPQQLEIEILESAAIGDIQQVHDAIIACQKLGIKFSLDDFGTGYSSLSYLKRLPANTLKIDQSFVRDILDDNEDLALVQAIIGLAKNFNRDVIAEGVETMDHGKLLMELGCDFAQGYGIAKPMPAERVIAWAENYKKSTILERNKHIVLPTMIIN